MRAGLSILFIFFTTWVSAQFSDTVVVDSRQHHYDLSRHFDYLIDESRSLSIDQFDDRQLDFESIEDDVLRLDLTEANIWLTLSVKSNLTKKEDFVIEFADPTLYAITLYQKENGKYQSSHSGTSIGPNEKHPPGNKNNFKITLVPQETARLVFKINSKTSMTFSALLKPEKQANEEYMNQNILLGAYYAILFLLTLYSLFLYATTQIRPFLYYAFYVMSVGAFTAVADGFFSKYFHEFVVFLGGYHDITFFILSNVLGLIFMLDFLKVKRWSQRLHNFTVGYMIGFIVIILLLFVVSKPIMLMGIQVIGLITLGLYIIAGILGVKNKADQAMYYLVAYLAFGVFIIIFTLSMFRMIPYSFIVQYSIHFGYALSIVILSYGLIQRLYLVYGKLLDKEKEKKQIIAQKNKELELKVAKRTAAIAKKEVNLRSILDNTDDSIWLIDREYKLIDFNRVFAESWHTTFGNHLALEKNILELNPVKEDREKWRKRYDESLAGKNMVYVDTYEFGDSTHHFEVRGFPIKENGQVKGVAYFAKEITQRLKAEKQLKEQNEMLTKVNKELDSFVYSASHDLKAPLASVLGLINLVRKESDLDTRLQYYNMMERSVIRLDAFIKDIIDYSRNERTEVLYKTVEFEKILNGVFEDLKYIDGSSDIEKIINIDTKSEFYNDPVRVRVALRNLISNAIKYGCANGVKEKKIAVNITADESQVMIEVIDWGHGIPEKHLPHVFEMFYRAHEDSAGTGLGLYIVKETVEKLQGSIEVASRPEQGSKFTVIIPNKKEAVR